MLRSKASRGTTEFNSTTQSHASLVPRDPNLKKKFLGFITLGNVNLFPIFLLGSASLSVLVLGLQLLTMVWVYSIAVTNPPRLVELSSGQTITAASLSINKGVGNNTDPVKVSAYNKILALYNWNGFTESIRVEDFGKPQRDTGVPIPGDNQQLYLSTSAWKMGFAIQEPFRSAYLPKLAKAFPQEFFKSGVGLNVIFMPAPEGERGAVQILGKGRYKVPVSGIVYWFENGNNLARTQPLNLEVELAEINPINLARELREVDPKLPKDQQEAIKNRNNLFKIVYEATKDGFMIVNILEK